MWAEPIHLTGQSVRLAPMEMSHASDLAEASADGELWKLWYTSVPHPDDIPAEMQRRLDLQADGRMAAFSIITPEGKPIGMTTFMNIDAANHRLEIGSTWYRASAQRSAMNTEAKLMLLSHCFEALDCIAVEFRTHVMNLQSRRAIERLGAKLDGVLRAHSRMPNGTIRDTAVYSITYYDWPSVQANLDWMLEKQRAE